MNPGCYYAITIQCWSIKKKYSFQGSQLQFFIFKKIHYCPFYSTNQNAISNTENSAFYQIAYETFGLELFFPHQDYKYFCFCNNGQFNIVRIHIGPWLVLLVQNHLLNSMTIYMKILHGYSAVLLMVCVCFCNPSSITIMRLMRTLYSHGHSLELQEWIEFFTLFFFKY